LIQKKKKEEDIRRKKTTKTIIHKKQISSINKGSQKSITSNIVCIICCERDANAVIMDCGHGGICYKCCIKQWKNGDDCYICRKKIREILQISIDENNKGNFIIVSATFNLDNENIEKIKKGVRK